MINTRFGLLLIRASDSGVFWPALFFKRGSFEVSVGTAEFKTTNEEHVHLILQEANLPLDLHVASVTGMVMLAGALPLLQMRESSAGQVICTETTNNLPLKRVATAVPAPWMRRASATRLLHASPKGEAHSAYRSPPMGINVSSFKNFYTVRSSLFRCESLSPMSETLQQTGSLRHRSTLRAATSGEIDVGANPLSKLHPRCSILRSFSQAGS